MLSRGYFGPHLPGPPAVRGAQVEANLPDLPLPGPEFLNRYLCEGAMDGLAQRMPKVERTLSAFGIEVAGPFFERRFVELAFTIPEAMKLRWGREKYILRRALRSVVPPDLLDIPKFPMRMKYDASFAEALDELGNRYLSPDRVKARGLFEPESAQRLRNYRRGTRYHAEGAMRLWTAVATEIWAEQFLDRRGAPLPQAGS
jgi:asparagine synthase (glutamine-hydrolysing)